MRAISRAAALAGIAFSANCGAIATDNWTTHQGNISRNGYVARTLRADLAAPAWRVTLPQRIVFGLAIYKGVLFTSSGSVVYSSGGTPLPPDVHLTARRLSDGQVLWDVDLGTFDTYTGIHVDSDSVYVATFNPNTIYAYATDGTPRWSKSFIGSTAFNHGPLAVNGSVYFFDGTYAHAYAAADGASLWDQPLATPGDGSAPTWWNGRLVRHSTNRLDTIDAATGQNAGGVGSGTSGAVAGTATVFGDNVYLLDGGSLSAYDLNNPTTPLWMPYAEPNASPAPVASARNIVMGGLISVDPQFGLSGWRTGVGQSFGTDTNSDLLMTDSHIIAFPGNLSSKVSLVSWATRLSDIDLPIGGKSSSIVTPLAYGADTLVVGSVDANLTNYTGYLDGFTLPTDNIFASPFE